jgi:hypothetical protein
MSLLSNLIYEIDFEGNLTDSKIAFLVSLEKMLLSAGIKGMLIQGPVLKYIATTTITSLNNLHSLLVEFSKYG